jgi:hypothetical protein
MSYDKVTKKEILDCWELDNEMDKMESGFSTNIKNQIDELEIIIWSNHYLANKKREQENKNPLQKPLKKRIIDEMEIINWCTNYLASKKR